VNVIERAVRGIDGVQQQSRPVGFLFGVVKKFGDDRGPALSALLTYYGFMSLFPLLLVLTTILGFIGNASIEHNVIGTTLKQFPVFGQQIGKDAAHPLTGSGMGLAFGLLGLLYGALGAAQASQHAMAQVWNVPGVIRPGFGPRLVRGLAFFAALGLGMALTAAVSGLATAAGQPFVIRMVGLVGGLALNVGLYLAVFRTLTPKSIETRDLVVGAVLGGIGYTILLAFGTALVQHQLRHAQAVYGQFAFVLGLISWLYLVSQLSLYAAELNVVRTRRLWPRSIVQPPLTDADERVLRDIAHQEERRPEQRVGVGFEPDPTGEAGADANQPPPRK
jgi:YihY family inner membrane protein